MRGKQGVGGLGLPFGANWGLNFPGGENPGPTKTPSFEHIPPWGGFPKKGVL